MIDARVVYKIIKDHKGLKIPYSEWFQKVRLGDHVTLDDMKFNDRLNDIPISLAIKIAKRAELYDNNLSDEEISIKLYEDINFDSKIMNLKESKKYLKEYIRTGNEFKKAIENLETNITPKESEALKKQIDTDAEVFSLQQQSKHITNWMDELFKPKVNEKV